MSLITSADIIPKVQFFNQRNPRLPEALMPPVPFPLTRCPHCNGNVIIEKYSFYWDATCLQGACTIAEWRPGMKEWRMFERKPVEVAPEIVAQEEADDLDLAELMEPYDLNDEDLERIFGRLANDEDIHLYGEAL
jgi:hypothetical protein